MNKNNFFHGIAEELSMGALTAPAERVTGGYLHEMYKLETASGKYAVKLLNPVIMKRPDVFENYRRAELLEKELCENKIPVIPAMEINGCKMQCKDGQYFYVFHWIEGKALAWDEIKAEHCREAGALLARIHKIRQVKEPSDIKEICADWDFYVAAADTECREIAGELEKNRDLLYYCQEQYNSALRLLPPVSCICDGDMDCKNVLWTDGKPVIIDLECLDYGNPLSEMFQLGLSWSGGTVCSMNYESLNAFISAYKKEYGDLNPNWNAIYGIGFSWLDWLEYNVKRALRIECGSEEERKLGIGQVHETLRRIIYYHTIKDELLKQLSN